VRIGLIAGTGMDVLIPTKESPEISTPYGPAYVADVAFGSQQVALLRRHGPSQNVPPHLINYKANLWALQHAGVDRILATATVGTMRRDLQPGSLAVISDFIDFTKRRNTTMFDQAGEAVVHVDFSTPYCPDISCAIEQAAAELSIRLGPRLTYVCVDGPRYETPAEVRMFAQWGGDVVGMTGVPEVIFAREMGMCYGALAIVTNYAAGIADRPLSHEEVVTCMTEHRQQVCDILERAVALIPEIRRCCFAP